MAIVPLSGLIRERVGKGAARQARRSGQIPGVIYGHGQAATAVAIHTREFETAARHHAGGNMIVSLQVPGGDRTALIRDVQRDPVSQEILHIDFQEVSLTEKVRVEVGIHLVGAPRGVKEGGGILEHILRHVEVECLATAIPSHIDADVTALFIGDSLHVRDLKVSDAEILTDGDDTIATVVPPTVYEEPVAAEAAETAEAAEPELVGKAKEDGDEDGDEGEKKDKEK